VLVLGAVIAAIATYRDRALRQNCSEFVQRYGD